MSNTPKFLVIDDNGDGRYLLVKTLLRKFPKAVIQECQHAESAIEIAREQKLTAIVAHRAAEMDGILLVQMLRRVNPQVPIIMVSGLDRTSEATAAGANGFLNYDEWLRIGTYLVDLLAGAKLSGGPGNEASVATKQSDPMSAA
jgi:CheY-like chemotaxis protein